jgi:hypothetical protein
MRTINPRNRCLVALLFLGPLLLFTSPSLAAEFSARVTFTTDKVVSTGTAYVKGCNMRRDLTSAAHLTSTTITIFRCDKKLMWTLDPANMTCIEARPIYSGLNNVDAAGRTEAGATRQYLGRETVAGLTCEKYVFHYTDPKIGDITYWIARELAYPIRFEQKGEGIYLIEEYSDIRVGAVSDALFEVPAGYQIIRMF